MLSEIALPFLSLTPVLLSFPSRWRRKWGRRREIPRRRPPPALPVPIPLSRGPLPPPAPLPGTSHGHLPPEPPPEEDSLWPRHNLTCRCVCGSNPMFSFSASSFLRSRGADHVTAHINCSQRQKRNRIRCIYSSELKLCWRCKKTLKVTPGIWLMAFFGFLKLQNNLFLCVRVTQVKLLKISFYFRINYSLYLHFYLCVFVSAPIKSSLFVLFWVRSYSSLAQSHIKKGVTVAGKQLNHSPSFLHPNSEFNNEHHRDINSGLIISSSYICSNLFCLVKDDVAGGQYLFTPNWFI